METFKDIINGETPVLVDFHATWCGPCKTMGPVLEDVKSELGDRLRVLKIDVDRNSSLADRLKIRGVPTFIFYKKGEIIWRQSGGMSKNQMIGRILESV